MVPGNAATSFPRFVEGRQRRQRASLWVWRSWHFRGDLGRPWRTAANPGTHPGTLPTDSGERTRYRQSSPARTLIQPFATSIAIRSGGVCRPGSGCPLAALRTTRRSVPPAGTHTRRATGRMGSNTSRGGIHLQARSTVLGPAGPSRARRPPQHTSPTGTGCRTPVVPNGRTHSTSGVGRKPLASRPVTAWDHRRKRRPE